MNPTEPVDWLCRHRQGAIDLGALMVACGLAAAVIPGTDHAAAILVFALVAALLVPQPVRSESDPWWRLALARLPAQLGISAVFALGNWLILSGSWRNLAFGPLWMSLAFVGHGVAARYHDLHRWYLDLGHRLQPRLAPNGDHGSLRVDLTLTGVLIIAASGWLIGHLAPGNGPRSLFILVAGLVWIAVDLIPVRRWQNLGRPEGRLAAYSTRIVIWGLTMAALASAAGHSQPTLRGAIALAAIGLLTQGLTNAPGLVGRGENLRWIVALGFAFWLVHPFAGPEPLGAGDSFWYALTLQDVLTQVHAGVFPVFVGQSIDQFNGSIFPVRIAPLFHHLGIALDLVTLRTLGAASVQHLVLILCGMAAGGSAYATLRSLLRPAPWLAVVLAGLYCACPGILATVYHTDLYMTWTTVPWLPVALYGCIRSFTEKGFRPLIPLVGGLAMIWWGHSPVALWTTFLLGLAQLVRLWRFRSDRSSWTGSVAAAVLFLLLTAYPMVSVLVVTPEAGGDNRGYAGADPSAITYFVQESFPGVIQPLSANGRALSDFQLGWPLWILCAATLVLAIRSRRVESAVLVSAAAALLLLLTPFPGLNLLLWKLVPTFIRDPTGNWVMNRLYLITGSFIVFAAAAALRDFASWTPGKRRGWLVVLLLGVLWNSWEARKFMAGTATNRGNLADKPSALLPENATLTRYSYLVFNGPPAYFSHGVVDPYFEQRLFASDRRTLLASPESVLTAPDPSPAARLIATGSLRGAPEPLASSWKLSPSLRIEPGKHYALQIDFASPTATGVLIVDGPSLHRIYGLPNYGEPKSFGSQPGASHVLSLFTSGNVAGDLTLRFVAQEASAKASFSGFGTYRWLEVDRAALPIAVTGWIPYTADVRAPADAWLETSRMFQQGYVATVNGREAGIVKSEQGLVMIKVPSGSSRVVLEYHAPAALQTSYWVSLLAFAGLMTTAWKWRTRPT